MTRSDDFFIKIWDVSSKQIIFIIEINGQSLNLSITQFLTNVKKSLNTGIGIGTNQYCEHTYMVVSTFDKDLGNGGLFNI